MTIFIGTIILIAIVVIIFIVYNIIACRVHQFYSWDEDDNWLTKNYMIKQKQYKRTYWVAYYRSQIWGWCRLDIDGYITGVRGWESRSDRFPVLNSRLSSREDALSAINSRKNRKRVMLKKIKKKKAKKRWFPKTVSKELFNVDSVPYKGVNLRNK